MRYAKQKKNEPILRLFNIEIVLNNKRLFLIFHLSATLWYFMKETKQQNTQSIENRD
jgi:hypothetical protein